MENGRRIKVVCNVNGNSIEIYVGEGKQTFKWLANVIESRLRDQKILRRTFSQDQCLISAIKNERGELINPLDRIEEHTTSEGLSLRAETFVTFPLDEWGNPIIPPWLKSSSIRSDVGFNWCTEIDAWRHRLTETERESERAGESYSHRQLSSLIQIGGVFSSSEAQTAFDLDWPQMRWNWFSSLFPKPNRIELSHTTSNSSPRNLNSTSTKSSSTTTTTSPTFGPSALSSLRTSSSSIYPTLCNLYAHYCGHGEVGRRYGMSLYDLSHLLLSSLTLHPLPLPLSNFSLNPPSHDFIHALIEHCFNLVLKKNLEEEKEEGKETAKDVSIRRAEEKTTSPSSSLSSSSSKRTESKEPSSSLLSPPPPPPPSSSSSSLPPHPLLTRSSFLQILCAISLYLSQLSSTSSSSSPFTSSSTSSTITNSISFLSTISIPPHSLIQLPSHLTHLFSHSLTPFLSTLHSSFTFYSSDPLTKKSFKDGFHLARHSFLSSSQPHPFWGPSISLSSFRNLLLHSSLLPPFDSLPPPPSSPFHSSSSSSSTIYSRSGNNNNNNNNGENGMGGGDLSWVERGFMSNVFSAILPTLPRPTSPLPTSAQTTSSTQPPPPTSSTPSYHSSSSSTSYHSFLPPPPVTPPLWGRTLVLSEFLEVIGRTALTLSVLDAPNRPSLSEGQRIRMALHLLGEGGDPTDGSSLSSSSYSTSLTLGDGIGLAEGKNREKEENSSSKRSYATGGGGSEEKVPSVGGKVGKMKGMKETSNQSTSTLSSTRRK